MDKMQGIKEEPVFLHNDIYNSSTSDVPAAAGDRYGYQDDQNNDGTLIKSEPEISALFGPKIEIEIEEHNPTMEKDGMQKSTSDVPAATDNCCGYRDDHDSDAYIKSEPEKVFLLEPKSEIQEHNKTMEGGGMLVLLDVNKGVYDEEESASGTSLHEGRSSHNGVRITVCNSKDSHCNSGTSKKPDNSESFNKKYTDSSYLKKCAENAVDCHVHGEALRKLLGMKSKMLTCEEKCMCKELFDHESYNLLEAVMRQNEQTLLKVASDEEVTQKSVRGLSKDCPTCGKIFKKHWNVRRHILQVHERKHAVMRQNGQTLLKVASDEEVTQKWVRGLSKDCPICGKIFKKHWNVRRHILQVHERKHSFVCNTCGKTFSERYGLTHHEITHTDERKFSCSECGTGFKYRSSLMTHISAGHKGVRSRLNLMKRISTGHKVVRSYPCTTCGKAFADQDQLSVHILVHTGKRPYKFVTRRTLVKLT